MTITPEEWAQRIMKRLTHKPYQRQPLMVFMRNGSGSREESLRVIADELRAAVAAEREQCARDVCEFCDQPEKYEKAVFDEEYAEWIHRNKNNGSMTWCKANAIRKRGQAESVP